MSIAKVIALAGANGYVGKSFVNALLDTNAFQLRILTRAESIESAPLQEFKSRGASLHAISYEDESSIAKALQGVDVLIATVAGNALVPLIKAAKSAGVKTYFPSEYGSVYEDTNPSPLLQYKNTVLEAAKEVGLPVTVLSNGAFPEYCFVPPLGYSFAEKKVTIWGDGTHKASWTTVRSVADWIANVLNTVPIEQLQDKHFRIQGNAISPNEIIKLWEQKYNDKLQVDYRPVKEIEERLSANNEDFLATLIQHWASGHSEIGGKDNGLYPGWKPDTVESVL